MALKIIGVSYLEEHSGMQKKLEVPEDHVIVDRKDWWEIISYFRQHPEAFAKVINHKSQITYEQDNNG